MRVEDSASDPVVQSNMSAESGDLTNAAQWIALILGGVSLVAASLAMAFGLYGIYQGEPVARYGLAFAAAFLFLLVCTQVTLHLAGAPQRNRLVNDTAATVGNAVRSLALRFSTSERSESAGKLAKDSAATATRWALFLATRGMLTSLIATTLTSVLGLLTVFVAYQQLRLLESQTQIMNDQRGVMISDSNNRLLEYHLSALVEDIRTNTRSSEIGQLKISWDVLLERANVISRSLRHSIDVVNEYTAAASSMERGILFTTLIAENFRFDETDRRLWLQYANLASLAGGDPNRLVRLGRVDLRHATATEGSFVGFDLSEIDLRQARLPPASNFQGAVLRRFVRGDIFKLQRSPLIRSVELERAVVPNATWLRELEGVASTNGFGALPWQLEALDGEHRVMPNPNVMLRGAEVALAEMADEEISCSTIETCATPPKFCAHVETLSAVANTPEQLGSLFVLAKSVREIAYSEYRELADREVRKKVWQVAEELDHCVIKTIFSGSKEVDLSWLRLSLVSFENADLTRTSWNKSMISGYFHGAMLPSAERFSGAHRIQFRDGIDARVPTPDWEFRVCMAHPFSEAAHILDPYFFDFTSHDVVRRGDGFHLVPSSTECPLRLGNVGDLAEFCRVCAPIPE